MNRKRTLACVCLLATAACSALQREPAVLWDGTGDHHFEITTDEPLAQTYFDQGLVLTYGFNFDEAVRSFEEAARIDPDCAMAYWGQAYAHGPNMNHGIDEVRAQRAARAIRKALARRDGASELERDLIDALAVRVAQPVVEGREVIDGAYAGAMRTLWNKYPDNADVGFLYADALVNETPWELWSADFEPNFNTEEAIAVLDRVLELDQNHPAANHFYIHAWEPSGQAWRAEAAADRLGKITPGLGHMVHMPAHIYVQVGRYQDSVECNAEGARLDREYFARVGPQGIYHGYQAHNTHFRVWSAMYIGAYEEALAACEILIEDLPPPMLEDPFVSQWIGMDQKVHLRFGRWEEALASPQPAESQPYARALWHYGRGIAFANTERFDEARAEAQAFEGEVETIPSDDPEFFESVEKVMTIAREMLAGEIAYKEGDREAGLAHLRQAVEAEDSLDYSEPSPWMVPTRHSLGALLLDADQVAEAEEVYRKDLVKHPGNIWSLHGLAECLERSGKSEEAAEVRGQYDEVRAHATVEIRASCYCRSVG